MELFNERRRRLSQQELGVSHPDWINPVPNPDPNVGALTSPHSGETSLPMAIS